MGRYVILGNGVAGTRAAEMLRDLDQDAEIVVVTEEVHPFYRRPLLVTTSRVGWVLVFWRAGRRISMKPSALNFSWIVARSQWTLQPRWLPCLTAKNWDTTSCWWQPDGSRWVPKILRMTGSST